MYCKYCGKMVDGDSKYCVDCGKSIINENLSDDKPSKGFAFLGFFVPLIGLILYAVYENKQPKRAKSAAKGALIGFITEIVVCIVIIVLTGFFTSSITRNIMEYADTYTNDVAPIEETADFDIEFGELEISNDGYMYNTSLEVSITNRSDKQKTFFITIEAVDEYGVRIGTDIIMADRLNPNQKTRLTAFEFIPKAEIEQYKTAEFKVLEVQQY